MDLTLREPAATATGSRGVPRRAWWLVAVAGALGLALLAVGLVASRARSADLAADLGAGPVLAVPQVVRTAAAPVALVVPALGLDTRLAGLHAGPQGLEVNENPRRAGWYAEGPAPGDLGPAVLAGHLDSRAGPGVFAGLLRLAPGDTVDVRRADGTTARFAVRSVETFAKRAFPTARVYAGDGTATLRIVTCGGDYDPDSGRYRSNTIVFADLVADDLTA